MSINSCLKICQLVALCLVIFLSTTLAIDKILQGRIAVNETEFDYIAFINITGSPRDPKPKFRCVAAIVNETMLVTACHCMAEWNKKGEPELRKLDTITVMAGALDLKSPNMQIRKVTAIYVHPKCHYNKTLIGFYGKRDHRLEYDTAHFIVDKPFDFTGNLKPMKTLTQKTQAAYEAYTKELQKNKTNCTVQGWGYRKLKDFMNGTVDYYDEPDVMEIADITIIDAAECTNTICNYVPPWHWICNDMPHGEYHTCARSSVPYSQNGSAECLGDSGSPLVCNGYPVAITSWGFGCDKGMPSFYSLLSNHIQYLFGENTTPTTLWKFTGNLSDLEDLPIAPISTDVGLINVTESTILQHNPSQLPPSQVPLSPDKRESKCSTIRNSFLLMSTMFLISFPFQLH